MSASFIDYTALEQGVVHSKPYPYMVLPQFIKKEHLEPLVAAFPTIQHRGSIPVSAVTAHPLFKGLIEELETLNIDGDTRYMYIAVSGM